MLFVPILAEPRKGKENAQLLNTEARNRDRNLKAKLLQIASRNGVKRKEVNGIRIGKRSHPKNICKSSTSIHRGAHLKSQTTRAPIAICFRKVLRNKARDVGPALMLQFELHPLRRVFSIRNGILVASGHYRDPSRLGTDEEGSCR